MTELKKDQYEIDFPTIDTTGFLSKKMVPAIHLGSKSEKYIVKVICDIMQITPLEFSGSRKTRSHVHARRVYVYIMRTYGNVSCVSLARRLNKFDHSPIIYLYKSFFDHMRPGWDGAKEFRVNLFKISKKLERFGWFVYDDAVDVSDGGW